MANYHDIFQKGQDDIVPLAMQAMKLKMEQEQFELVKNQALKKIADENALKERMSKLFEPKTEEVTLPEVKAPVVPSAFGGNVPQFGLPEMKVPRTVQPQPSPMEVLMATADLMTPEEFARAYTDIKGKPTVHSLAPGNILVDSAGNKLGENTNEKQETVRNPITLKSADGKYEQMFKYNDVTKTWDIPVGERHPVASQIPHVTVTTGGNYHFKPGTLDYMAEIYESTGQVPSFGMGSAGMKARAEFFNKVAERAALRGDTGAAQVARAAETKANTSALTDLTKREQLIESYNYRIKETSDKVLIPLVKKWNLQNPRLANLPVNKLSEVMGSGDLASLKLALNSVSVEVGKVEFNALGIQQLTDSAAKFMKDVHDENMSVGELLKVIETSKQLGETGKNAIKQQRSDLRSRMKTNVATPNNPSPEQPKATHKYIPGKGIVEIK